MNAEDEKTLKQKIEDFDKWCEKESKEDEGFCSFRDYFANHYVQRAKCWALCFRKDAGINTNMRLEAMHKVLKYCYLHGKVNNRVDKLISVLLKFTRDKIFD